MMSDAEIEILAKKLFEAVLERLFSAKFNLEQLKSIRDKCDKFIKQSEAKK